MKTVEFKLDLTQEQEKTIDSWLSALKPIWNYGLSLYEEDQQRRWRDKFKITAPLGLCLKWNSKTKKPVGVGVLETKKGYQYCPLRTKHIIPDTKKAINQAYRFYEQDWVLAVCSRARIALIRNTLKDAWNSYQKGIRRRPRFKGKLDKIVSFSNNSSAKDCKIKNNKIRLAALGWVKAKGLSDRWDSSLELKQYRVIKQVSGYYGSVGVEGKKV